MTLGNYHGYDGLAVKDLPEMTVTNSSVEFEQTPTKIVVRPELSKTRHQYFTFLSNEGCEYIKTYLEERVLQGEKLKLDSPIITPKQGMKPFIRTVNIGDTIRKAIRKTGFPWRPYVLRSYFDTQLMLAESKGRVLRDYRKFWMGHKGDIENRYTTNKCRLPETVIEDMRQAYKRSQEYLQTIMLEETDSEERLRQAFSMHALTRSGFWGLKFNLLSLYSLYSLLYLATRTSLLYSLLSQKTVCVCQSHARIQDLSFLLIL